MHINIEKYKLAFILYRKQTYSASLKYRTFNLGAEQYGIDIQYVTEIIGVQKITPVPNTPNFIKGVINLRGKVIPIMDIRLRFDLSERDYDDRTCVIVMIMGSTFAGLVVDTVSEVVVIPENVVQAAPTRSSTEQEFIKGLGKYEDEIKILLDINKLFATEDMELVDNMATA